MTSAVDATVLKGLAKGRNRLPPPPVDGNPQIAGRPKNQELLLAAAEEAPVDAGTHTAQGPAIPVAHVSEPPTVNVDELPATEGVPTATICPLAVRQHESLASPSAQGSPYRRMDGRTMRKTNRTLQLATKVKPEFDDALRTIALDEGILIVEVLERSLDLYQHMAALAAANGETPRQAMQRLLGATP